MMFRSLVEEVRFVVEGGGSRRRKSGRQADTYGSKDMVPTIGTNSSEDARHSLKWSHARDSLKDREREHRIDKKAAKLGQPALSARTPAGGALRKGTDARSDMNRISREKKLWPSTRKPNPSRLPR